jgi:hypothetical protein
VAKVTKATADPTATSNYLQEALIAYDTLGKAISLLQARSFGFAGFAETNIINAKVPQLQAEQLKVHAEMLAFLYQGAQIEPPTDADYANVKTLSDSLDTMNANSNTADDILSAATHILASWNNTH